MGLIPAAKTFAGSIARFFLPWACAGCRTPLETIDDTGFCGRCWLFLPRIQGCVCGLCGLYLKDGGNRCFSCREEPFKLLVRAAVSYTGPVVSAVHRFKYAGRKTLGLSFRALMEFAWNQYPELQPVDTLVPVPLHPSSFRERGYNQARVLAQDLSAVTRLPLSDVLLRPKKTTAQFKLRKSQRRANIQGAFALAPGAASVKTRHLLLVDDVCTTGATLQECSKLLRRAGAAGVKALVLARDI